MTTHLELPLWRLAHFYNQHTLTLLSEICTPFESAVPGDTVGILMKVSLAEGMTFIDPVQMIYRMSEIPSRLDPVFLTSLPDAEIDRIAKDLLLAQAMGFYSSAIEFAANRFKSPNYTPADPLYVMALQNYALIYPHDYDTKALRADSVDQHIVNKSMLAIQTDVPETAHEEIELLLRAEKFVDIVNATVPLPGSCQLKLPSAGPSNLTAKAV